MMNDKERILMQLISDLHSTITLGPAHFPYNSEAFTSKDFGELTHFAPWKDPVVGDLVFCMTGPVDGNDFKIGFVHQITSSDRCLIREIGSNRLCDYGNERFIPIRGLSEIDLLEGDKYLFYKKVRAAFDRGDEFLYRFGGIHFEGELAIITIRERYGGFVEFREKGSQPITVSIKWNKRTTIKAILQALRDGGYGTHKFQEAAT